MRKINILNVLIDSIAFYITASIILDSFTFPLIIVIPKILLLWVAGIYKILLKFFGFYEIKIFLLFNLIGCLPYLFFRAEYLLIDYIITASIFILIRYIQRYYLYNRSKLELSYLKKPRRRKALIIGAGEAGYMCFREIKRHPDSGISVIGFIDDNPQKIGMRVSGKKVLGNRYNISDIVRNKNIDLIIIAIPSAPPKEINKIISICEKVDVQVKIVPSTIEIIKGDVKYEQIRDLKIEDLLGREEINLDTNIIAKYIKNKKVLITGAGGSIGSELARQIAQFGPNKIVLLGKGENSIFNINFELGKKFKNLKIYPVICDIRDKDGIEKIFKEYRPDIVFHSAAHKHVYLMELYPDEAFKNNLIGTLNLAEVAVKYNTKRFILISTDKSVYPKSIMGMTKRLAENIVLGFMQAEKNKDTEFVVVRFGNVFASRGSVVPIFQRQIESGGPVTVTHPDAVRYFMTIPEAVQLVLQSSALGRGGEIFILDMGKPVKISDLAKKMIRLSGYEPGRDIRIRYTGLKPGEKLKEELFEKDEKVEKTLFKEILKATPRRVNFKRLINQIKRGEKIISTLTRQEVKNYLKNLLKI